jgi:large subunit ribosomal protein L5
MSTVRGDDNIEERQDASPEEQPQAAASEASTAEEPKPRQRRQSTRSGAAGGGTGARGGRRRASAREATPEQSAVEVEEAAPVGLPTPRLKELWRDEVVPTMVREMGYKNVMQAPRIHKIALNVGLGEALTNGRAIESATNDLTTISGQKPVVTRARKSIAGFKLREGNAVGITVTLRGDRMYYFFDRLVNTALPRIRDFRGVSSASFDGRGNYSMGIREQIIFPEIEYNRIERIRGFQVTITTTAKTDAEGSMLLSLMGMPFARQN